MGVLQRFERRLEGMVEGAFARAFKSEVEPVEIASAVQREMDDRAAIVAQGRTLVPNDFVVELSDADHERLEVYADSLGIELATLAREHAKEQGYSFVGPVRMRFEGVPDLTTGTFRIRSGVIWGTTVEGGEIPDCAGMIAAVEAVTDQTVEVVVGKPSPIILEVALAALGCAPAESVIVGDRLETDMLMGRRLGLATILVLSGVTRPGDPRIAATAPDHVLRSIRELAE